MISQVHIKNYQNHKETTLDFTNGLNVISGSSDNGKSAVVRAMVWCLTNEPRGFDFRRNGAKKPTSVRIAFTNGTWVERLRSSSENQYTIFNGTEEVTLKALGSGIPKEVTDLTNIADINIQSQFNQFFMLQESSGEVARKLNEIVGLDIIDSSLSKVNSIIKSDNKNISDKEQDQKYKQEQLTAYEDIPILDSRIENAQNLINTYYSIKEILSNISTIVKMENLENQINSIPIYNVNLLKSVDEKIKQYETILTFLQSNDIINKISYIKEQVSSIPEIDIDTRNIKEKIERAGELKSMCMNIEQLLDEHERINNAYNETEEFLSCRGIYDKVCHSVDKYEEGEGELRWLDRMLEKDRELTKQAESILAVVNKNKQEKKELQEELGTCPVCGKEFEGDCC